MRTITDAAFDGFDLANREEKLDVLRIAGSLITDSAIEKVVNAYNEKGLAALPAMLDILNCTELTDKGISLIAVRMLGMPCLGI